MDPTDRGTAFIFADGAGAAVIGPRPMDTVGNCQKSGISRGWG